ncbi:nickel-dependent lactate racemase [Candidatus Thorarchaeota archaeon]|nr:MAG: nickel-dependent lactate racemase [Candidatus Thorarchaeota archaeon]
MKVEYSGSEEEIEIPDTCNVNVVKPKSVETSKSESTMIRDALSDPIESVSFEEFTENHESFLVIVNDHARRTPTPVVLKEILPFLQDQEFKIIIASGTHARPSEEDIRELILGEFYDELRNSVILHSAKESEMFELGESSRGTPLRFNAIVNDFEAFIPINSIEPHYFAGFTGGRKSLFPGIAEYGTVEANHSMALLEEAQLLRLEGNPLHEDMEEAVRMLLEEHPTFAINIVQDGAGKVARVVAGDIFKQLYVGAETAREIYAPEIDRPAEIVLSVVHSPLDQDLYQGAKGFENTRMAVKDGGILILVAACPGGIGSEDYERMMTSAESVEEMYQKFLEVKEDYELGWHKVGSIPPFLDKNDLWIVTEMPEEKVCSMHMKGFDSVQAAIDAAIDKLGTDIDVLVVHDSGNVSPVSK